MLRFRNSKNIEKIVREEFPRMPTLHHKRDSIRVFKNLVHNVDYHSFKDNGTLFYFIFNLSNRSVGLIKPKTAYQRNININSKGRGYGRELIETGERICERLGISDIRIDNPFGSDYGVWNLDPSFWEHFGYVNGYKRLSM